jgi:hypothetical protein
MVAINFNRILMYVQCKNYFLGKTTNERFSRRAPVTTTTEVVVTPFQETSSSNKKIQEQGVSSNGDNISEKLILSPDS